MSQVLLCSQPMKADVLNNLCGIHPSFLNGQACSQNDSLSAYTPYILNESLNSNDTQILSVLSQHHTTHNLTNLLLTFGEDNTLALAEITKKLQEFNVGLIGASTSVYANRVNGFARAVQEYQSALMAYRTAIESNSATKAIAKQKALDAFKNLQVRFNHELSAVNVDIKSQRGTPLSSPTRATNIARSSRNVAKLNITSQAQAHNLVKFSKHTTVLGNGIAVIDFTNRAGNILNEYQAGGEWERELFIESSSFAASAGAGVVTVNAGTAALGLLMVATPIGWVGLVIGGLAIAGTAAATSIAVNKAIKDNSGSWYDSIMEAIGIK